MCQKGVPEQAHGTLDEGGGPTLAMAIKPMRSCVDSAMTPRCQYRPSSTAPNPNHGHRNADLTPHQIDTTVFGLFNRDVMATLFVPLENLLGGGCGTSRKPTLQTNGRNGMRGE